MPAEYTVTEYHQLFVNKYFNILEENSIALAKVIAEIKAAKQFISKHVSDYKEMKIDLNNYTKEIKDEKYDFDSDLYSKISDIFESNKYPEHRVAIIQLIKYIEFLGKKYDLEQVIEEYTKYSGMYRDDYIRLLKAYYCAIGNFMIKGYGYKLAKGTGIIYAEKFIWNKPRKVINLTESKRNKKRLILEGKKVYNKKDEYMAKLFGVEYNPEEYRVYKEKSSGYRLKITKSAPSVIPLGAAPATVMNYTLPQRKQVSGISMIDIANNPSLKNMEDVYELTCGMGAKLYIADIRFPEATINLLRHQVKNVH